MLFSDSLNVWVTPPGRNLTTHLFIFTRRQQSSSTRSLHPFSVITVSRLRLIAGVEFISAASVSIPPPGRATSITGAVSVHSVCSGERGRKREELRVGNWYNYVPSFFSGGRLSERCSLPLGLITPSVWASHLFNNQSNHFLLRFNTSKEDTSGWFLLTLPLRAN